MKDRSSGPRRKAVADESGVTLVLLSLFIVALFGFAALSIDVARVFQEQRHIQIAADAAALAGATLLTNATQDAEVVMKEANAVAMANDVAAKEIHAGQGHYTGNNPNQVQIGVWTNGIFDANHTTPQGRYNAVRMPVHREVDLMFAKVVGMSTMDPKVRSVAMLDSVGCPQGPSPLGVTSNILAGATIGSTITVGEKQGESGQWGQLDFNGGIQTSGDWEKAMLNGYTGTVCVASSLHADTNPGADRVKKTMQELLDSGQTIIVPMIPTFDNVYGQVSVDIIGFVGLQVVGLNDHGSGSTMEITFKYVSALTSGPGGGPSGDVFAKTRTLVQ